MKKILVATNILLLSLLFFGFGKKDSELKKKQGATQMAQPGIYADGIIDTSDRTGLISYALASEMSQLYRNDLSKSRVNTGPVNPNVKLRQRDATAIWFSVDMLKHFIDKIEKSVSNKDPKLKLGVRIYYALYPKSSEWSTHHDLFDLTAGLVANKHTVFLVPTFRDTIGKKIMDFDFNADYTGSGTKPLTFDSIPKRIKDSLPIFAFPPKKELFLAPVITKTFVKKPGSHLTDTVSHVVLQNHGGLSPPPETGVFPTTPTNNP